MVDLSELPADVLGAVRDMARDEGETLIGWKAVTEPEPGNPGRVRPVGYIIITDTGYYESRPDGVFTRAAVLHPFPEEVA